MKPSQYGTIMPIIALESLKLIDIDEIVSLIGNDLNEIYRFLSNTAYKEEVVRSCGDQVEPALLEDALYQNYAKTFNKLLKYSSKYIKNLLLSILHKIDASNLKTMLRMVQAGIKVEEILKHIIPLGTYNKNKCLEVLSNVNSISNIIESIREEDFGFILKKKFIDQNISGNLITLEAVLEKEVYKEILNAIKNLNRTDKKIAHNILGIEIDVLNVKIIIKNKTMTDYFEPIKRILIPPALIDKKTLESAIKEPDLKSVFKIILKSVKNKHPVYQSIFSKLVDKFESPLSQLEFILEKAPIEMSYFELKKNLRYYNIGYILAFLNMKWVEIKNLICIINAMVRNVDGDQTFNLLILPENY
jgi:vacuolar-type H+-ATPase subunit C/Vma6